MNDDQRTQAEKDAAKALIAAHRQRQQHEQDARGPNPLQQPAPRYPRGTIGEEQAGGAEEQPA